ncbi:MAG: alkaline shock response membrane anchor protein AmaP [Actinomycetota bacterium]|nr:alkaline shock response membrane anchor protein AmaP [Actinomycetota bacterium]
MTAPTARTTTAARKATARAAGAQRTVVGLIGLLSLAAGALALVVGFGLLGTDRAARPVLDPLVLDTLGTYQTLARGLAVAAGVILLILGLLWAVRALAPERRPDLLLDHSSDQRLEISASAIADAVRADAETIAGVNRVRARMVGATATPVLRLDLWLEDGTDVRDVYRDLDIGVLARARESLGVESLPTAIRIELDAAAPARVM